MGLKVTQLGVLVLRRSGPSSQAPAASSFAVTPGAAAEVEQRYFYGVAETRIRFYSGPTFTAQSHVHYAGAASFLGLSPGAGGRRIAVTPVATTVYLVPAATAGKDLHVHAETSMGFSSGTDEDEGLIEADAAAMVFLHPQAEVGVGTFGTVSSIRISARADAGLDTSEEILIPGGDLSNGMLRVLASGVSGDFPLSFIEASGGILLSANGIDPMLRWDGLTVEAEAAGVVPPGTPLVMTGSGDGLIVGKRWAYSRYVDVHGNVSNLSPVDGPVVLGTSAWIVALVAGPGGAPVATSPGHGLATGDTVSFFGIDELPVHGAFAVVVIDDDTFEVDGISVPAGRISRPGYWVKGAATVTYSGCPVPADPRIARRQVLRNLDGSAEVFYVDVDTDDLTSTTLSSARTDDDLSGRESVPFRFDDEMPAANRHGVPPSHKAVLEFHLGRAFASVDRPYTIGHAEVSLGGQVVRGVGTRWVPSMEGRPFYAEGASRTHFVERVLAKNYLALDVPYRGPSSKFSRYSIRPSDQESRLVYYSEPNAPESWPPWNAFSVPEHGDEITALMSMGSYLYVIEKRHISSFTYKSDPGRDGFVFLKSHRGCINSRCYALVEGMAYMLDEAGIHRFDGDSSTHLSARISNIFNDTTYPYRLDWASPNVLLWHACQDPVTETVRWFVDFVGKDRLTHAICYDYRRDRWWIEQYPEAVASSCLSTLGYRRILAGTTARRVLVLADGNLDGISGGSYGTLQGTVSLASDTTLTVPRSDPPLPENLAGVPLVFTSGRAKGQMSIVVANDDAGIQVWHPFDVKPARGDTYQLGGIPWSWRGGWLPLLDQETDNARDLGVVFKPTASGHSFDARMYYDYADEPRALGVDRSVDGITTRAGSADINVDTGKVRGYAIQRMQGRREAYSLSDYFLSVNLSGTQGGDPTRIFEVIVSGVFSQEK